MFEVKVKELSINKEFGDIIIVKTVNAAAHKLADELLKRLDKKNVQTILIHDKLSLLLRIETKS